MLLFFTTVAIWAVIGILAINGIEEMLGYRHKPIEQHVGDSTKDDIPMKGDDHWIDPVRYVINKIDNSMSLLAN